jgi:hypothetical protein
MTTLQKIITGVVAIGLVTTAVLPKRNTASVINASGGALSGLFATVMGTGGASTKAV